MQPPNRRYHLGVNRQMMEDEQNAAVIHEDQQPPDILPSISRILSDHRESSSSNSSTGRIPNFPDNEDFISLSQDIQHESQSYYVDTTGVPPTTAELTAAFMCPPTLDEMMIQVRELRLQRTTVMAGFRFRDPTPAATSFSSPTTTPPFSSSWRGATSSITEDMHFSTPSRRGGADEYDQQRTPTKGRLNNYDRVFASGIL